jgi:hypothetical protein
MFVMPVDLRKYCNAFAATFDSDRSLGSINAWGNSFPAEELPFGTMLTLNGVRFCLPPKEAGAPDHIEALGQVITLPARRMCGLGLLAFGEMGSQALGIDIEFPGEKTAFFRVVAPAWLIAGVPQPDDGRIICSHLHYVGGYELSFLRPAMWCVCVEWPDAIPLRMRLGINPFFHLLAVSELTELSNGTTENGIERF